MLAHIHLAHIPRGIWQVGKEARGIHSRKREVSHADKNGIRRRAGKEVTEGKSERANERQREREGKQKTGEKVRGSRDAAERTFRVSINEARSVMEQRLRYGEQSHLDRSGFRTPRGRASFDRARSGPISREVWTYQRPTSLPHPLNIN
jgi:hypothetical protein